MKIFSKPSPESTLQQDIIVLLPHGSGINCKWELKDYTDNSSTFSNSFQVMNDVGYYVGYVHFSVAFKKSDVGKVELKAIKIHGQRSHQLSRRFDIRCYLDDLFADWFDDLGYVYCV